MRRLFGLFSLVSLLFAPPAFADILIDNVDGMTMGANGEVIRFKAIIVDDQGRVVRLVQSAADLPKPQKADRKNPKPLFSGRADLGGRVVIPGFIDAHGHVMEYGLRSLELDLADTVSLADARTRITAFVAANPARRWILGGGWNQEKWGLGRFPTAAELDAIVGDKPVWLMRADGHAGWANSAALKAAGITAKTPTPEGGRIEKLANGEPSGVLVDKATALIEKVIPQPSGKDRDLALFYAQQKLLAFGITATADMGTSLEDWMAFRRLGDRDALRVRIMSYGLGVDTAVLIGGGAPTPWLYDGRLRMGGVKLYADGALGSRGAWLKQPYSDAPGERGLGFMTDDKLQNLMVRAAMDGFQIAVHAIGDRANAQVLDAIEAISDTYKGDLRWRIEHAQVVDPVDLPRFKKLGVIASMQPTHATSDRLMAEARLGPERLKGAYAWATMLKMGVPLAFGSDYPVESPDPFAGWAAAFTRQDANGAPAGGWRPEERVTREQAWWAFTAGGAYAGFAEKRFGRLAPGQYADFIVIDRDPLIVSPADLRKTTVLETWIAGVQVYRKADAARLPPPDAQGR